MIGWDRNKVVDIREWSICGGGWLERLYCIWHTFPFIPLYSHYTSHICAYMDPCFYSCIVICMSMYLEMSKCVYKIYMYSCIWYICTHLYVNKNIYLYIDTYYVVKMGNIVPRAGIEPISLAFWVSVLILRHIGSLMSPLYPCLPVCAVPCPRGQCSLLLSSPWNWKSFHTYNYIYKGSQFI